MSNYDTSLTKPSTHPGHYFVAQVKQFSLETDAGVSCIICGLDSEVFFSSMEANADSLRILIFVAPTVMAMAIVSSNSSSVAPSSLATARQ